MVVEKGEFKEWVDKKTGKTKRQAWYYEALQKGNEDAPADQYQSFKKHETF